MKAKGYTVIYICESCESVYKYTQYGIKSDMMIALRRMIDPPFCHKCSPTTRMGVLHVTSELCVESNIKYGVAWRCDKCFSRWSTYEQLNNGQKFSDLGMTKGNKPGCIRQACTSEPENIRLTSVTQVQP